jgi:hypothetical protein
MATPPPERTALEKIFNGVVTWAAVAVVGGLLLWMLLPWPDYRPRPASRTECKNHLKQFVLAMHNYHDKYGSFPPAFIADKEGRPMHSWRVLLLPFLEFDPLYDQYRFDEPWNGPHNRELAALPIQLFRCPLDPGAATDTNYFVVVGPKTIFPGASSTKIADIPDGTSNTILLVEATDSGINWLEPRDMSYSEAVRGINPKTGWGISSRHEKGAQIGLADGTVRFFPDETPVEQLRRLLERNDGQEVSWPKF